MKKLSILNVGMNSMGVMNRRFGEFNVMEVLQMK
jgi:hypothetical protein